MFLKIDCLNGDPNGQVATISGTDGVDEVFLTTEDPPTTATTEEVSRGTLDSHTLFEAPPNSLVTVTTSLGAIMNPDADDELQGIQVLTDTLGQASILIRRPAERHVPLRSNHWLRPRHRRHVDRRERFRDQRHQC